MEDFSHSFHKCIQPEKVLIRRISFLTLLRHPGKCFATFPCPLPADILNVGQFELLCGST